MVVWLDGSFSFTTCMENEKMIFRIYCIKMIFLI